MNIDLKKRLYQTSSLLLGANLGATFNNAPGSTVVTETIRALSLSDVQRTNAPSMRPYGFTSLPNPNTIQVVLPAGVTSNNAIVLGHLDVFNGKPFSLLSGESVIYSNDMAVKVGNAAVQYYYGNNTATAISGEDVNQVFVDVISYLQDVIQGFMEDVVSIYNNHVHPTGSGNTGGPISQYPSAPTFPQDLTNDLTSVQEGKTLINSSGITPLP